MAATVEPSATPALLIDEVDRAVVCDDPLGPGEHLRTVRDVDGGDAHLGAELLATPAGRGEPLAVDVAEGDLHAAARELLGERRADARCRTGDRCDPARTDPHRADRSDGVELSSSSSSSSGRRAMAR